ncbi:MAG TPA: ATP-binding protein [Actinomycetota bacterium]|nr:ATP-binding protein [Actinomycetota bacterium]
MASSDDRTAWTRLELDEPPFRSLVERVPAIVYVDPAGPGPTSPTYISPYITQLLGYAPEDATRGPEWWASILHPDDRERVLAEWAHCDDTGEPYAGEYRLLAADGRTVWIRDEAVLLRDERGASVHWQGVMLDVTAAKQAQEDLEHALELERTAAEEMRRADEIKTTFLTAVSHDIRTPLSAILGNALTLEGADRLRITEEERKQLIQSLAAKARRLNAIVTDLLDTERLARGVVEPKLQEIAVGRLISLLVWDSEAMAGRQVHVDTRSVTAWVDPQMISRIVENLLTNAARHTAPECQIWVRVVPEGDSVLIAVEDDGPGIPEEHREAVFRPFEHGPMTSVHNPGVGIGLSLVARFAELHGGRAWVEEREGGGASFRVLVPRGDPETAPPGAATPTADRRSSAAGDAD